MIHLQVAVTIVLKTEEELKRLMEETGDYVNFAGEENLQDHAAEVTRKNFSEAVKDWATNNNAYGHWVKTEFFREDTPDPMDETR